MRYLIETNSDHAKYIGALIARWEKEDKINLIEKGDPIEAIRTDLIKISNALETLEKSGIDKDIMIAYIKTKGVPVSMIRSVLYYQQEFLKKLGVK